MDYIRVEGGSFRAGAAAFRVVGANCYYLGFGSDAMVSQVFQLAADLHLNTLRTSAFSQGEPDWTKLDRTIAWAEQKGIRLILPLVNYWDDILGMKAWSARFGFEGQQPFYTQPAVRDAFRSYITDLLSRVNTLTGRQYRDEPAVLAWELANEPRCDGADPSVVLNWAAEMTAAIKAAGAQQLVSLGDEGFFRRWGAGSNALYNGSHGMDHEALLGIPDIDFGTCHLYPEFEAGTDPGDFGTRWIREHIEAARRASKPAIIEEYGIKADAVRRDATFARWLAEVEANGGAGSLLWMIAGNNDDGSRYYDDGYTVYSAAETPSIVAAGERQNGFVS
jgi:mannan endo-1,4-beta-mannosidase